MKLLILLIMGALSACSFLEEYSPAAVKEKQQANILKYVETNDRPDFVREALVNLRPTRGMSDADIRFLYGNPVRVNSASYGTQKVYTQVCRYGRPGHIFQDNIYVYFKNGLVTDWQIGSCW